MDPVDIATYRLNRPSALCQFSEKSCIRETQTILTNADRSINTLFSALEVPSKCHQSAIEVALKWRWIGVEVALKCQQPTATATYLTLLTPPSSTVGWSKTVHNRYLRKWDPKVEKRSPPFFLISFSSQANIRNMFIDRRSAWHAEVISFSGRRHTTYKIQTDIATTRLTRTRAPSQWKTVFVLSFPLESEK